MNNLAVVYGAAGRHADEIALHETTLKQREAKLGHDHPDLLQSRQNLGVAYEGVGRWADAEPMCASKLAHHRKTEPPDSPVVASDLAVLALNLQKQAKWQEAEAPLRECLGIRAKAMPDGWLRFNTIGQLGEVLLGQARYAEAEPLVIQGYEQMKAREATIPPAGKSRLSEAATRVVRMYEAWGKPETAARWKATLGLADLPTDVLRGRERLSRVPRPQTGEVLASDRGTRNIWPRDGNGDTSRLSPKLYCPAHRDEAVEHRWVG